MPSPSSPSSTFGPDAYGRRTRGSTGSGRLGNWQTRLGEGTSTDHGRSGDRRSHRGEDVTEHPAAGPRRRLRPTPVDRPHHPASHRRPARPGNPGAPLRRRPPVARTPFQRRLGQPRRAGVRPCPPRCRGGVPGGHHRRRRSLPPPRSLPTGTRRPHRRPAATSRSLTLCRGEPGFSAGFVHDACQTLDQAHADKHRRIRGEGTHGARNDVHRQPRQEGPSSAQGVLSGPRTS